MPFKDPVKRAEANRRYCKKYDEAHREQRRAASRERYRDDPEKEIQRSIAVKERLLSERRCVRCGKISDHKSLCLACVPKQAEACRKWLLNLKKETFIAYGGCKCKCCGESFFEFLTLDHINNDGAAHRKELRGGDGYSGGGGGRLYRWLKRRGYPKGYRVLCWNCNSAIGSYGYCPHSDPDSAMIV